MIKLINYKNDSKGEVIYLAKSSISEIKRIFVTENNQAFNIINPQKVVYAIPELTERLQRYIMEA